MQQLAVGGGDLRLAEEGIQLTNVQPSWVHHVDAIENIFVELQTGMDELLALHAQRISSVFHHNVDSMEAAIDSATASMTQRFRTAERHLQSIGQATRGQALGANVQRSLASRLQALSVQFRQSQRTYLRDVQAQKSGAAISAADSKFGITFDEASFLTTAAQEQMVDDLTAAVQSRDQEIAKIAQSIEELGTIFKELAVLVIDQGTILDRIDYNMEAVVDHTKTGIKQLERAERTQQNARPLRCIICLSMTVFVLLVIFILKHHRW